MVLASCLAFHFAWESFTSDRFPRIWRYGARAIGAVVRYVCAASLASPLRRDFIVIDDTVGGELSLDSGRHFQRATFYTTHEEAENLERVYQDLSFYAKVFDPNKTISCPATAGDTSDTVLPSKSGPSHQ